MADGPTEYTIYLENNSATTKNFWCFLAPPQELDNKKVFANSSTNLAVAPHSQDVNTFTIPVQYVVGAAASNEAVGLNIKVETYNTKPADLTDVFEAKYKTIPPKMGPTLAKVSTASPANTIRMDSNSFNRGTNEDGGWFSNMSFGIKTEQGFIGMTWAPPPQDKKTITPELSFYIACGSFGANSLARWEDVSESCARLQVPVDFDLLCATVTLDGTGSFVVTPGKPKNAP